MENQKEIKKPLIIIGESIHASIPKTAEVMKKLCELGPAAYSTPSEPLNYIKALIKSQAAKGADYIAVNLDAFGEDDPQISVDMMRQYVKLVRRWSDGMPICIDSSNNDVLIAGLKEWYDISEGRRQKTEDRLDLPSFNHAQDRPVGRAPLINSVKVYTMDEMLPLKKDFGFAFIGLLMSDPRSFASQKRSSGGTGPGGSHSVDELYSLAQQIFDAAIGRYDFGANEIYFDTTVFPLAIDMPMEPGVPGYTYRTFETIKKIKSNQNMRGAHCVLGVSNCARDLPGRKVGVCRAYVAKAMEYGLDAVIANVEHHYGSIEPAGELLELVDAYTQMDGSVEGTNKAMELMSKFCQENRKQAK
jgi:hypothetical protein